MRMQQCLFLCWCGLWAAAQLHPTVGAVEAGDREGRKGGCSYLRHQIWQLGPPPDKSLELSAGSSVTLYAKQQLCLY